MLSDKILRFTFSKNISKEYALIIFIRNLDAIPSK